MTWIIKSDKGYLHLYDVELYGVLKPTKWMTEQIYARRFSDRNYAIEVAVKMASHGARPVKLTSRSVERDRCMKCFCKVSTPELCPQCEHDEAIVNRTDPELFGSENESEEP